MLVKLAGAGGGQLGGQFRRKGQTLGLLFMQRPRGILQIPGFEGDGICFVVLR
jgi:hypothetical protein